MKFNNIILGFICSAQSGYAQEDQQQVTFTGKLGDECNTISECEPSFKCVRTVTDFVFKFICSSPDSTDAPIVNRPITFIEKEGDACGRFLKCESPLKCEFDISILIGSKELKRPIRSTGTSCVHICTNTLFIDVCLVGETCSGPDETGECVGTSAPTPTPVPSTKAPTNETCTAYAYDDTRYCKCPAPVKSLTNCHISVCGDATYELTLAEGELPCSGTDEAPGGTVCPKKGSQTRMHCRLEIMSYLFGGKSGACVAPEDAVCQKLTTGAWGCVFPGNCNAVNTCTDKVVADDNYQKDVHNEIVVADNGYPVCVEEYQTVLNTADYPKLPAYVKSLVPSNCDLAYDTNTACKSQTPVPHYANRDKMEVSVCGDATYLLDEEITPCSGNSDVDPAGTGCPKKNAETTLACRKNILSYFAGDSSGICSAPEDAICEKLNTGAWGCVFPGNANTVNTCVDVHPVSENYKVDAEGKTMAGENGYPLLTDVAIQKQMVDIDTTTLTKPSESDNGETTSSDTPVMMWSTLAIMTGLSLLGFATM